MTKDTVQHLFEISFDAPAATSLCVRFEELPVVPENVARARNLPEVSIGTRQSSSACASLPGDLKLFQTRGNIHPLLSAQGPQNVSEFCTALLNMLQTYAYYRWLAHTGLLLSNFL